MSQHTTHTMTHTITITPSAKSAAPVTQLRKNNLCINVCTMIGYTMSTLCIACFVYALPIAELVVGVTYRNNIHKCDSQLLSIATWLIVNGSVGCFTYTCKLIINMARSMKNDSFHTFAAILLVPYICSIAFTIAWLVTGSIIFWRDCIHVEPQSLNIMVWCSLIIGYCTHAYIALNV